MVARWDAGLSADQRAFVIGYGRLGFRPSLAPEAVLPIIQDDFQAGRRTGNAERQQLELAADYLAEPLICKAIKAYRKHLADLDAEPLTQVEARGILADVARTGEACERIKAVGELAKLEGWGSHAKARLRLLEAQADAAAASVAPPDGLGAVVALPVASDAEAWGLAVTDG